MSFKDEAEKTAKQVLKEAEHLAAKAVQLAGELTHTNRDKIDTALDKATAFVDSKTDGKYAPHLAKVKDAAGKGVDFVAAQKDADVPPRPGRPGPSGQAGTQDATMAPPVGPTPYPSPVPPYQPPHA